jgi:AcrR family transcriptional regulator
VTVRKKSDAAKRARKREKNDVRRVPMQARSRKRFDAILRAAAEAFADDGFESTRMEGIAEAAGTSIGSVYQFFSNKRALFRAVAEQCLDRSREVFGLLIASDFASKTWPQLIDEAVDAFARLHESDPAFRALISNIQLYGEFEEADRALMAEFSTASALVFGHWAPQVSVERREVIASTIVNTIAVTLVARAREPAARGEIMLQELKLMLHRYLAPELTGAG